MKANRDISKLNGDFKLKVLDFISDKETQKLGVFITEGFRTRERQQWLYNSGRTRPGPILTWVKRGMHNEGLAIDIACNKKEFGLYPKNKSWWEKVYNIASKYGIDSLYKLYGVDKPHLQDNGKTYKPTKIYKNNFKIMENLKQEFYENSLELVIISNSNLWKASDNPELKEKLAEFNAYLRKLKQ